MMSGPSAPDTAAIRALNETKQSFRAQGFKMEIADFDFSTTAEDRAREAVLQKAGPLFDRQQREFAPNFLQPVGNDSALVVWQQDSLAYAQARAWGNDKSISWEDFRGHLHIRQEEIDAAAAAILAGPIRFNVKVRPEGDLLLPHLALLQNLAYTFAGRTVLAMHDGDEDQAWQICWP